MKESALRVASLISGGGTTMESVGKAAKSGELGNVDLVAVIASKPDAGGLQKAEKLGIQTFVVDKKSLKEPGAFRDELLRILRQVQPDLVSQNGWLPITPTEVVQEFETINQHPGALDPEHGNVDFGGKGMYGSRVTCARIAYGWLTGENQATTESTVHCVTADERFDRGEIIKALPLDISDTMIQQPRTIEEIETNSTLASLLVSQTEKIQKLLLPLEHKAVKRVLRDFAERSITLFYRPTPLIPPEYKKQLEQAKQLAIQLFPKG